MKRFTETTKWDDPWFRRLSPTAKLLWSYLTDKCDCIGLIELDADSASFHIGSKVEEEHITELESRLQRLKNGKVFIPKFIPFQYGNLSVDCRAHGPVFKAIDLHGLTTDGIAYSYPINRVSIGMDIPSRKRTGQGKGQEEGDARGRIESPNHAAFVKGWCDNFEEKFKTKYAFNGGQDGKAVKQLLSLGITIIDLLEIAKKSWDYYDLTKYRSAGSISGFAKNLNQIQVELKNGNRTQASGRNSENHRNTGVASAGPTVAEQVALKIQRQNEKRG